MKKYFIAASLMLIVLSVTSLGGCGASKQSTEVKFYIPPFTWNSPDTVSTLSSGLTIAIISPQYSSNSTWINIPLFKTFVKRIDSKFQELLIAKGLVIKGPYKNVNEMTFPDKKNSDLGIYPKIELNIDYSRFPVKSQTNFLTNKVTYYREGVITLSGTINLVVIETLTGAKMWTKNIPLLPVSVKSISSFATSAYPTSVDFTDPQINNPIAKEVERYFKQILDKAWNYINVKEMQLVKKQSLEVRKKKVY